MKIDQIIPYERNARKNEKAVPVVADSIREFGFRGQIVLESPDNPVIVTGHTRVAACKLLGWDEIPDENICFADDLTPEQIMAYRLADNRTGEVAGWNKQLLKSEIRKLDKAGFDMTRFQFDFKSKYRQTGAERLRTDDYYNLTVCNKSVTGGKFDMPPIEPCGEIPDALLPFNYAMSEKTSDAWLHFFKDDYQFERLWNSPQKYLELLKGFGGLLSPDFSLYMDMPLPMQQWNEYRRRALSFYWQKSGLNVIPTLSWTTPESFGFCFSDLPKHSTVAVSTVGVMRDAMARDVWFEGMEAAIKALKPETVLIYGSNIGFDFKCRVVEYDASISFTERKG